MPFCCLMDADQNHDAVKLYSHAFNLTWPCSGPDGADPKNTSGETDPLLD